MTREEIQEFQIALDKLVDLAVSNNKPSLPADLDEAAEEYSLPFRGSRDIWKSDIIDAFKAEVKWQKQKMTKDAVEGEVYKFGEAAYVKERNNAELTKYLSQFNNGDRVKIIVIHETDIR